MAIFSEYKGGVLSLFSELFRLVQSPISHHGHHCAGLKPDFDYGDYNKRALAIV